MIETLTNKTKIIIVFNLLNVMKLNWNVFLLDRSNLRYVMKHFEKKIEKNATARKKNELKFSLWSIQRSGYEWIISHPGNEIN